MKVSPPVTEQWFEGEDQMRIKPPSDTQVQTGHKRKLTQEAEMSASKRQRGSNMDLHAPEVDRTSSPHQQDNQTKCSSINKISQKDEMTDLPSSNMPDHARSAGDVTDNNIRRRVTVEEVQDEDDIPGLHHNDDDDDDDENDKTDHVESASTAAAAIYTAFTETNISGKDPKLLKEAMNSPEWPEWEKAIQIELEMLQRMGTWELMDAPKDRKPITNKWVFVRKYSKDGILQKYKAHLIARGFSQIPGMDYNEMFSPVVCLEMICTILALAMAEDWEIQQMDIKGTYLNGTLKEDIYMDQPQGYNNSMS